MNTPRLAVAMGHIDDDLVSGAIEYRPVPIQRRWLRYAAVAACIMFVGTTVFRLSISFMGSQATDIYSVGDFIVLNNITDIPGEYNGGLLAENLDLTFANEVSIKLYFNDNGTAENTADWYSLLIGADYPDYSLTMFCLFDNTKSVDDWKVHVVFTPKATQTIEINGTVVSIARREISLNYEYTYYAIFEYDDVVYDIRVGSNDEDRIYTVLNDIFSETVK